MEDPEPATVGLNGAPQVRVTGYLIVFTVLGAAIGRRIAQVDPVDVLKGGARRAAESETLDNLITYVLIGATLGFAIGFIGERWLPEWSNKFWIYAIIATSLLFAFRLAVLPWAMP